MPLLPGETLEQRLQRAPPLPMAEVLRIGGEIAAGLAAAHARGFIHRDVKPSNVWLEGDDQAARVKILDFGLARVLGSDATLTHAGAIVGTPAYMAPEQARGEPLDVRCDLFSLGCVLYRMTTGAAPFKGPTTMATLRALELLTPRAPHLVNRAVPRALSELIVQLLAKRPDDRPASAVAVTAALEAVREGRPPTVPARRRRVAMATVLLTVLVVAGVWLSLLDWRARPTGEPADAVLFAPAVHYKSGLYPQCMAVGDFNGDGKLDLAVANAQSHQVSVLLGNGDGTFADPISSPAGEWFASSVTAADFDGDGKLDLVVANAGSHMISVLRGKGDGSFHALVQYPVAPGPHSVVVGDFNGDGALDLAVATTSGAVSVLAGKGDGTFHAAVPFATGKDCRGIAMGDFDGDGKLDLAVTSHHGTVSVLLGKGDGTFRDAVAYRLSAAAAGVVVGDFNGDGKPDLAVAAVEGVQVMLGNGDGTFQAAVHFAAGSKPRAIIAGDFNGDGKLDLAVANDGGGNISVLLGNGDGTFQTAQNHAVGMRPEHLAAGDFNGDGRLDLAVANYDSNHVSVLLGKPVPYRAAFDAANPYATGKEPYAVAVADFNRDCRLDLVVAERGSGTVSVLLGKGDGTVYDAVAYAAGTQPVAVAVADVNRDGRPDLVVANSGDGTVSVLLGKADGTFHAAVPYATGKEPLAVAVADVNRDGKPDLIVADHGSRTLSVLLGKGDGTFAAAVSIPLAQAPTFVAAGDFDGDGKVDLAVTHSFQVGSVSVLRGKGDGTFHDPVKFSVGAYPKALAVGDFNSDGKLDLAVVNWGSNDMNLLAGNGDGTFRDPVNFAAGANPLAVVAADFDGDGKLDLAVAGAGGVGLLRGDGRGAFQPPALYHAGIHPAGLAVGDFSGNGKRAVAVVDAHGAGVAVLRNRPAAAHLHLGSWEGATRMAGASTSVHIEALNAENQRDTGYTGTVHFHASDPQVVVPADYTFTAADQGIRGFPLTVGTAGTLRVTVEDAAGARPAGRWTVRVLAPSDLHFSLVAPATATLGKPFSVMVTVEDPYRQPAPFYGGTVRLSCNERSATVPADFAFTKGDGNVHTAAGVILRQPGPWTITAADAVGGVGPGSATVTVK